jgi:hypothetical protein
MTFPTIELSDYGAYLEFEYPRGSDGAPAARAADEHERQGRLAAFPHSVVLKVAFAEMDYANRWCWQQFGPARGECRQRRSEYPTCTLEDPHSHDGSWLSHWLAKTAYNFGFNEWCFRQSADLARFLGFVPHITWGEKFPR